MKERSYALDALRGYAIVTMVLSGSIVFGILPGWMYHAQTPPPSNVFNPDISGITWVDLVFPFFLFAMGAAFPFSIGKRLSEGVSKFKILLDTSKRALQLVFFAIFIQHFYPWVLSNPQDVRAWLLSLTCFALLFPMFMRMPFEAPKWVHSAIKIGAYVVAFLLLYFTDYAGGRKFDPYFSNIIILVLANMAFFGTIVYIFTAHSKILRLAILPFVMAIFLAKDIEGSLAKMIFTWTPLAWMYKFAFLKYLFIVLPGSIAGEYVYEWMKNKEDDDSVDKRIVNRSAIMLLGVALLVIVSNVVCLYNRWLLPNLIINGLLFALAYWVQRNTISRHQKLWKQLFTLGAYLTLLGLFFESYEGGIKKDPSTFSYYFLCSGLAFLAMVIFHIICDYYKYTRSTAFLVMSGQNPMIAYVATNLLTIPILNLIGVYSYFSIFSQNVWLGALQGVVITSIAVVVTMFFTRIKWFWRT